MPGPDNIFVLTESLTKGKRNGIAISIGLSLGVLVHTTAAAMGLSLIILKSATVFSVIKYIGAAYLFYLAYKATNEHKPTLHFEVIRASNTLVFSKLIKKGFLMNILNPKVALFFIAFLPQFITPNGINTTIQMVVLGVLFMIQALLIFSLIAILSGKLTKYVNNPKFWRITKWSKISVLSLLGLSLAFSNK